MFEMAAQSCITCCLLNNNQVAPSDEWKGITEFDYVARSLHRPSDMFVDKEAVSLLKNGDDCSTFV